MTGVQTCALPICEYELVAHALCNPSGLKFPPPGIDDFYSDPLTGTIARVPGYLAAVEFSPALGQSYEHGRGVPKDYAEALRWYRLAAEQGDPFAQFDLGSHYSEGIGVPKDEKEALRWWQSAAAQGFPPAQHSLGKVLARGEQGVLPDKVQAYV